MEKKVLEQHQLQPDDVCAPNKSVFIRAALFITKAQKWGPSLPDPEVFAGSDDVQLHWRCVEVAFSDLGGELCVFGDLPRDYARKWQVGENESEAAKHVSGLPLESLAIPH